MLKNQFFDFSGTLVKMRPATLLVDIVLPKKLLKKFKLGIITGAKRKETTNILSKLQIYNLFQMIITADDSSLRKPDPKLLPKLPICGYVGDTVKDSIFAKNTKTPFFRVNKKYNINQVIENLIK